jgi:hypothetical protein
MAQVEYALSLKQPWAALLVHGYKSVEIRKWSTTRRGQVLIHAARVPDLRPEVWARVPAALRQAARIQGGIVGAADLVDCVVYRTLEVFAADRNCHWNEPDWFSGPVLFGFVFANMAPVPFRRYAGFPRFFPVIDPPQRLGSGVREFDFNDEMRNPNDEE